MLFETIFGAATGLIGNVVSGIFKFKTAKLNLKSKKMDHEHELAMVQAETAAMIEEAKANIKITQAQVEGAVELKEMDAYIASQKEGNKAFLGQKWIEYLLKVEGKMRYITIPIAGLIAVAFGFVDFLRGLMRPTLTMYLTLVSSWITWKSYEILKALNADLTAQQATEIFSESTSIVIYLTVSCVTWWFGDRTLSKTIMELRGADRTKMDDKINL